MRRSNMFNTIEYRSIDDVRSKFGSQNETRFLFRGESDGHGSINEHWSLTSSFKRYFSGNELSFLTFLVHNLESGTFSGFFQNYKYPGSDKMPTAPLLEKLYFLQHYGVPTCLIDFTRNPFIALYFAISGLRIPYGRQFRNGNYISFEQNRYIKVYQLDIELLRSIFQIKDFDKNSLDKDYNKFKVVQSNYRDVFMAIDSRPSENIEYLDNYNLENQEGCFVLYDNSSDTNNLSLDQFLLEMLSNNKKDPKDFPFITEHRFFLSQLRGRNETDSLFHFIRYEKGIRGSELFNDIQGLKFDLLQIHDFGW